MVSIEILVKIWQQTVNFHQNREFRDFDDQRFSGFPGFGPN